MNKYPTKSDIREIIEGQAKGAVSAIPVIGGCISESLSFILNSPLEKRKEEWLNSLGNIVEELKEEIKGLDLKNLRDNPLFISTILYSTQIALKTHKQEKLDWLKKAVKNSIKLNIEEDKKMMFLNYIDILTPSHIKLLRFLDNPKKWIEENKITTPSWTATGIGTIIEFCITEFHNQREFYDSLVNDLHKNNLCCDSSTLHSTMSIEGALSPRITTLGKEFLNFILF
jgi:hypothetical protein